MTAQIVELPLLYRITAGVRRALGDDRSSRISASPFSKPLRSVLGRTAPSGTSVVEVCGGELAGAFMFLDLSCEKYYWLGTHEPQLQSLLARSVRPGDIVYDIGAHVGFFTLLAARLTGPAGRVIAFEPLKENFERLALNVSTNGLQHIELLGTAVSDASGQATFERHTSSLQGRLSERGGLVVETESIDGMVARGMPAPNLVKVDVEGAEAAVVRGARETIVAYRPRLLIEVHSTESGDDVLSALPVAYECYDVQTGLPRRAPLSPGHYELRPA